MYCEMATKSDDRSDFIWKAQPNSSHLLRHLTNTERMFVALNCDLYGQNCPFIGASLSIKNANFSGQSRIFDLVELRKRAVEAFCQTRWRYPTIAARVVENSKAVYSIDGDQEVKRWADRSVTVIIADGGWLALREQLSRDAPMPSSTGDYCNIYLVVNAEHHAAPNLNSFNILMHMHHVSSLWQSDVFRNMVPAFKNGKSFVTSPLCPRTSNSDILMTVTDFVSRITGFYRRFWHSKHPQRIHQPACQPIAIK